MALPSSGSISMNQIKDEFGGSGSHALSEYHALAGLGVSGIPASGAISFSHFRGKSKNVTTSVWTSSGYNTTSLVYLGTYYNGVWGQGPHFWNHDSGNQNYYFFGSSNPGRQSGSQSVSSSQWLPDYWWGDYRYSVGAYRWSNNNGNQRRYNMVVHQNQTTWTDTSSYQNTTITAQIST